MGGYARSPMWCPGKHLIQDYDGADARSQRLLHYKFCLLQRTFIRIHQKHCPIHHAKNSAKQP